MNIDDLNDALSDRYRIERELGRGGMAVVYLAHDWNLGRDVALKVLLPELAASIGGQRFLREIEIAAKLSHPNILSLHDRGEVDGLLYYTMPYVDGESLRDRLDREKQLPMDEALRIASQVADALHHAHEQGVVHRDIKPENILLQGEHALVADFGIARAVTEAGGEKLTQTGIAVGTVTYMAPEQSAAGKDVDARSDLYSLGCVLYEMIGGEPPFTGPSAQAIMARHALDPPPAVSTIRPATPPGVEEVILRSLAKNAVDRYKTAEHMRVVLSDPEIAVVKLRGRLSRLMRTRQARAVLGVAATAAVAFGVWQVLPIDTPVANPSAGVVVVLPFEVADDLERPLDAVSITNLLRNYFGYTERYRVVPAEQVRQAVENLCPTPPIERFCGSRVATELGAQFHLTGSVTPVRGDSVQIVAYLTDEMEGRSIPPVSIRGSQDSAYAAVSQLYRELVVASAGEGERPVALAGLNTENPAALAAFLDGELHLSELALSQAGNSFQQAVEIDSTFALAWYRLAIVRDWQNDPSGEIEAVQRAEAYSDQLGPRDRRALAAFRPLIEGRVAEAEAIYLELLEEDPDDVEALFQWGMLLWAYNWRRGRSISEAIPPLQRVLDLTPRNGNVANYLMWAHAATADVDAMDSIADAYPDVVSGFTSEVIRALREGDTVGLGTAIDSLKQIEAFDALNNQWIVGLATTHEFVPDLALQASTIREVSDSISIANHSSNDWLKNFSSHIGFSLLANFETGRGRMAAAGIALEEWDSWGVSPAVPYMVFHATLPSEVPWSGEYDSLLTRLEAWSIPDSLPVEAQSPLNFTARVYADLIRLYLAGLLKSQQGDYQAARVYADRLEALDAEWSAAPISVNRTVALDLSLGIQADVLLREGRPADALEVLDRAKWEFNYNEAFLGPVIAGERENYLRARALHALGRYDEALQFYSYGLEYRYLAMPLLASSHLHRGEIFEERGDTEKALWHYGAFVQLWREADPEYQSLVEDVRGRIARLAEED